MADGIRRGLSDPDGCCSPLQEKLIRRWHIGALLYILLVGLFWEVALVMGAHHLVNRLLFSFLLIPVYLLLDQWGDRMIRLTSDRIRTSAEEKLKASIGLAFFSKIKRFPCCLEFRLFLDHLSVMG